MILIVYISTLTRDQSNLYNPFLTVIDRGRIT